MRRLRILKKLACVLVTASILGTIGIGCGSKATTASGSGSESEAEGEVTTAGADDGEEFEMWTFVDLHAKFYEEMLNEWNEKNPDRKIKINFTVLPYDDMHNKLQSALLAGKGAPDMCDIEVGKFPNFLKGEPQLETFDDEVAQYDGIVQARLDLYSKDGHVYGLPTHVGATVAYYNTELLEAAGIDYKTIKTWDDFKAAGEKYYAATGKYLGTADTSAASQVSIMLAEQGTDYVDEDGNPKLNSPEMIKGLEKLKELQDAKAIATIPGGQPDTEEAFGAYNNGDYACVLKPLWYMSRFVNYMPELSGKIAIAPLPTFDGSICSVGDGGTGTVVTKTSKDPQLAKDFLAFAKLSKEGNIQIWEKLGFDPCNTSIWSDESITHDPNNEYVKYFQNNPFDILNEIKDNIRLIKSTSATSSAYNILCTVSLNSIFEDNQDIKQTLDEAQEQIENELK